MPFLDELGFKQLIILNNAVMDDEDPPMAIAVWMRIDFVRRAVGRPARVGDA